MNPPGKEYGEIRAALENAARQSAQTTI